MWRFVLFILLLMPTLVLGENHERNIFSTPLFSIEIPKGMEIDESAPNRISLVFENDPNLELGTISVSSQNHKNGIDKDKVWENIRSILTNGKKLLSEGEVQFAGQKWKSISMMDETGRLQIKSYGFYTFSNTASFILHYHCKASNCGKITDAFNQIALSFRAKKVQPLRPRGRQGPRRP